MKEPATFEITGVMSFPRLDFEVDLRRALTTLGATKAEVETYVAGLRRGGVLVFATGSDEDKKVDEAADIMNRCGAVGVGEAIGAEPQLPRVAYGSMIPAGENEALAGRVRQPADGAWVFVW